MNLLASNLLRLGVLAVSLLPALPAGAQTVFVNDATVYTMGSRGVLQAADVLLRDGLVEAVGRDLPAPPDATVIEAGGRPLTPGFFAGISALGLEEISLEESSVDNTLALEAMRPEFDVTRAYNPHASAIPVTRIEGYSWTVLGANRAGSIIGGRGRAVLLDGGYGSFTGAPALFIDVGADASQQSGGSRAGEWMLLEQAMAESAESGSGEFGPEPLLTRSGRQVLAGFKAAGITVFDVDRASDILQVLEFTARYGLRAVITGGAEAWMVADNLAEAGVPVVLDALRNLPGNFDQLGARLDNAALLNEAGVTVIFGGAGTHNARKLRQVAGNAVAYGLPYEAGLAALTVNPAAAFELPEGSGRVQPGSPADIVLWSGDPLEVTSAADQVVIGGKIIDMVSRQTLLRDRYLPQNPELPRAYIKP